MEATKFQPDFSGGPRVFVEGPGGPYIVDMSAKTCTCRRWDLTELPYHHGMVSILGKNELIEDYVMDYYKVENYNKVYSYYINPTGLEDHWPEVVGGGDILPPKVVKKKRGRKPKARRKEAEELEKQREVAAQSAKEKRAEKKKPQRISKKGTVQVNCSICKVVGHNARGHSKYAKTTSSSFPNQQPPSPNSSQDPAPTQNEDPAPNQSQEERIDVDLILTNQSTIEDVAEQDVVGRVVHGQKIVQGDTDAVKVSKRGREVKKKVMQDYVQVMVKKKCRLSKTNRDVCLKFLVFYKWHTLKLAQYIVSAFVFWLMHILFVVLLSKQYFV